MKKLVLSIFAVAAMATASMAQTAPVENPNAADFKFDTEVHDFGSIKEGVQAEHTFKFTNTGKEPLVITNVQASCGCTTPTWSKEPIKPGAQEGHGDLITLNHRNPAVVDYTVDVMNHWLGRGVDGWRLDAAYAVPEAFWAEVLPRVRSRFPQAWFVAEVIHGDYGAFVEGTGVDSVTQYELWKAIWSSLNDGNFHELDWAMQRHNGFLDTFAPLTFVGNHDVTRIASQLLRPEHLSHALVLLFTVGGVPAIYAGDEFAYRGVKEDRAGGDDAVRPEFGSPATYVDSAARETLNLHRYLIGLRRRHPWLYEARTTALRLENRFLAYEARHGDDALIVAVNIDDVPFSLPVETLIGRRAQLVAGTGAPPEEAVSTTEVPAHGWQVLRPT